MLTFLMNPPFPFYFSYNHGEDENYKNILAPPFLSIKHFLFPWQRIDKTVGFYWLWLLRDSLYLQVQYWENGRSLAWWATDTSRLVALSDWLFSIYGKWRNHVFKQTKHAYITVHVCKFTITTDFFAGNVSQPREI